MGTPLSGYSRSVAAGSSTRKSTGKPRPSRRASERPASDEVRRIVVVGTGDCGTRAAIGIREGGWDGELTLVGSETAVPYERPPLSKSVLTDANPAPTIIASDSRLSELEIEWRRGVAAVGLDPRRHRIELADGASLPFDRLLIATGARARRPAIAGPHLVMSLRTIDDASLLRERLTPGARLLVIGGGFIGLEVAASAVQRGCDVTVVEFAHRLMSRVVPAKVADIVQQRHLEAGVRIVCGMGVDRIVARGDARDVQLSDGSTLTVDVVVAGVGAVPNTELAATAGLTVSNGIAVDGRLRTDDASIFAAGDCCSFPHPLYGGQRVRLEAWKNALEHADIAGRNIVGGDEVCAAVPWFWSDQYDLGIQIAGLHAAAAYEVVRSRDDGYEVRFGFDNTGRIVSASGVAIGTSIGREISIAEMLIANRATPRPTELANPAINLREFLRVPA